MNRLRQLERHLSQHITHVELLGELDLKSESAEELGEQIRLLIRQRGSRRATHLLETSYPACFAVFLVAQGIYGYQKGDYWSSVAAATGIDLPNWSMRWGRFFEKFLRDRGLPTFPTLRGRRYVDRILIHGGIPDYCLPDFFEHLLQPALLRPDWNGLDAEELIFEWLHTASGRYFTDEPVLRFLEYGGAIAVDFVARCLDLAQSYISTGMLPLAEDIGLPVRVVAKYQEWTTARMQTTPVHITQARLHRPEIWLDPWGDGVVLDLPAQSLPDGPQRPHCVWTIDTDNTSGVRKGVRIWRNAGGWETEPDRLVLNHPAEAYTISFDDGRDMRRSWRFTGLARARPVLAFDPEDGRLVQWRGALPARELWLLYLKSESFQASGGVKRADLPELFEAWSDYRVEHWDLCNASTVRLGATTLPVAADEVRLRPHLEQSGLDLHTNNQQPSLYIGRPPSIIIPLPAQRDPELERARWHITIISEHDPTPRTVALKALGDEVKQVGSMLRLPLSSPKLLGPCPFGTFRVSLRGPLGRDATFSLAIVPVLQISGHERVRLPDAAGHWPKAEFVITTACDLTVDSPDRGIQIITQQPGNHRIVVPADRTLAKLRLHDPNSTNGASVALTVPLPVVHWHISDDQQTSRSDENTLIVRPQAWLDQHQSARLIVTIAPSSYAAYALVGRLFVHYDLKRPPQQLSPIRSASKQWLLFDLKSVADTVRASREANIWFELELHTLPGHEEAARIRVLSLTQLLGIEHVEVQGLRIDDTWLLELTWRGGRLLRDRHLRLWPLWRPWATPIDLPIPDDATDRHYWEIPYSELSPGAYRAEMTVVDQWSSQAPHRPDADAPQATGLILGSLQERRTHLASLPPDVPGHLERALAVEDEQACAGELQEVAAKATAQHLGMVLDTLLILAEGKHIADAIVDGTWSMLTVFQDILQKSPVELLIAAIQRSANLDEEARYRLVEILLALSPAHAELLEQIHQYGYAAFDALLQAIHVDADDHDTQSALRAELAAVGIQVRDVVDEDAHDLSEETDARLFYELTRNLPDWIVNDNVRLYLHEIGQIPLLTAEQEREIAARIRDGQMAVRELEMATNPVHASALLERVARGQQARERLINANLRLVVSIAKRYCYSGMPLLDLIQEGNLGLIRAVEKFDISKGYKFSTYATWWIRQAITRALADKSRPVRLPVHLTEHLKRVQAMHCRLAQDLGRDPTDAELARAVGITEGKLRKLLRAAQDPISLDTPVGEERDSTLGEFIPTPEDSDPFELAKSKVLQEQLTCALKQLTERERRVLQLRFGLEDGHSRTLEEVGKEFGVTRERIRQIEVKALRKLQHPRICKSLRDCLN